MDDFSDNTAAALHVKADKSVQSDDSEGTNIRHSKSQRRWGNGKKIAAVLLTFVLAVGLAAGGSAWYLQYRINKQLTRIDDPFKGLTNRPSQPALAGDKPVNILLLGSDARIAGANSNAATATGNRSDTMMLVQISGDRKAVNVLSIPRDSWVPIPGRGNGKINWAMSFGGPALAIETVEQLTEVRIDHFVAIDFKSFVAMTNTLGGVDIATVDGTKHFNGEGALTFVRTRSGLPGGDFDRQRRQQAWMKAIVQKVFAQEVLSNATKLMAILDATTKYTAVDEGFTVSNMRDLGLSMGSMRPGNIKFLALPNSGTGMVGDQSVVFVNIESTKQLCQAWRTDNVQKFLTENPNMVRQLDDGPIY